MRNLCLAIAFAAIAITAGPRAAAADSPYLSFSARLATADGTPVDGTRQIRFALYADLEGGAPLWTEQVDVEINDGFAYHALGARTALGAALFRTGSLYLEVAIGAEVFTPRLGLTSVPYARMADEALVAAEAGHAADADHADDATHAAGADTLGGLMASAFQRATSTSCAAGSFVSAIAVTGLVICTAAPAATGDVTGVYTPAGSGLMGGAGAGEINLAVDPAQVQHRVTGACAANSSIRAIDDAGLVTCEADTDTDTAAGRQFFSGCSWVRVGSSGNVSIFGTCPSGKVVVSGGCYGGNSGATVRRSAPSPMPSDGNGPGASNGWYCAWSGADVDNVLTALCCNYG